MKSGWRHPGPRRRVRTGGRRPGTTLSVADEAGIRARLLLIHGRAAACTITLVVIAAVAARA